MDAILYLRQSIDRTGDELGVTRQREDARKLAEARGLTIVAEHSDNDVSAAGKRTRPGFNAVLADLDTGKAKCVIAWDWTRLARNGRDTLRLIELGQKQGISVMLCRGTGDMDLSTPNGRMIASILASVAQQEIEQKSDRQRRATLQAAEQGRRVGGRRPFGYESDGVTIRETEARAIRAAYDDLLAGVPVSRIAADWNAQGLTSPQARRDGQPSTWLAQTVRPLLLNPRYAGLRSHMTEALLEAHGRDPRKARVAGIVGPAVWPGLVTEETWRAAVALLSDPSRSTNPQRAGRGLLTGVARCQCGAHVHRGTAAAGRATYRCKGPCGWSRAVGPVNDYVSAVVIERLERPDAARLLLADHRPDAAKLRTQALAISARIDELAGLYAEGILDAAGVRRESAKLRAQRAEIERQQADAGRVNVLGALVGAQHVRAAWKALDTDRQRAVIDVLMIVTVLPPGRGSHTFRPETVVIDWLA